jgi:hypothetical protein
MTDEEGIVVATRSGHLKIRSVTPSKGETAQPLRVGDRFHTPASDLEAALMVRTSYGSS